MIFSCLAHHSKFRLALIIILVLLAAETIATTHALEHEFTPDEDICFTCEKADNFKNSLFHVDFSPISGFVHQHLSNFIGLSLPTKKHPVTLCRGPPPLLDL